MGASFECEVVGAAQCVAAPISSVTPPLSNLVRMDAHIVGQQGWHSDCSHAE
jgi:hypothetical protein